MKKIYTTALCLLFYSGLTAQNFDISEETVSTDDIMISAWVVEVGSDLSFAKKTFSDYAKDNYNIKTKNLGKSVLLGEKLSLPTISVKRGDMKASFNTVGSSVKVGIGFLLGYDIFLSSEDYPDEMAKLKTFARDYLEFHYKEHYNEIIEGKEKQMKGLNKEIDKGQKEIKSLQKQIDRNNKKIQNETVEAKKVEMENKNELNAAKIQEISAREPEIKEKVAMVQTEIAG